MSNQKALYRTTEWLYHEMHRSVQQRVLLLLSERLVESRSVPGLLLCSARSMAILISSTHRSISEAQLDADRKQR